jgi:hypothetical protein
VSGLKVMGEWPSIDSRHYIVAFELHSTDDCPPDFELSPLMAGFDTGLFLPRGDPDWFGRSSYPPRILLLKAGELSIVSHPSAGEPPYRFVLEEISSVESGHMLLKGWLRFTGSGFDFTVRYNTRGLQSVLRFMGRFREKLLHGAEPRWPSTVHLGAGLDVKFANALARELDSGESVLMQVFQPPRAVRSRSWLLPYRLSIAGDLVALTSRRLLWITDRDRGSYSRYGSIASYARCDAVLNICLTSGRSGRILQVDLHSGSAWKVPIASESRWEHERVAKDFAAALEIQKRQNQASRTEVR